MRAPRLLLLSALVGGCDQASEWLDDVLDSDPGTEASPLSKPKDFGTPVGERTHQVTCDPLHGFVVGSTWFSIYDSESRKYDQGEDCTQDYITESFVERLDPEAQDEETGALLHGPGCRVRWSGKVAADGGELAAVGLIVTMSDLSEYSSVLVKTRGDGRVYRAAFPMKEAITDPDQGEDCKVDEYDFHGTDIGCGDGSGDWVTRELRFEDLEQEGWGKARQLDLSQVAQIQFFTRERPIDEFECDLAVVGVRK